MTSIKMKYVWFMRGSFLAAFIFSSIYSIAQNADFPLGHLAYTFLEMDDVDKVESFSTTIKPYSRILVYNFGGEKSDYLKLELQEFGNDSFPSSNSFFEKLYRNPADFYSYADDGLDLHLNPALQFSLGNSNEPGAETLFTNSRGIEIRGIIDGKVGFYTYLSENQARFPQYVNKVRDSTLVVPMEGFWKQYNKTGVDFFRAQGYVDFALSSSISAQLGYGKHFVGNGIRSLILSDFANNYPYLRINTETKIFDYTNIYAEHIANVQGGTFGILGSSGFLKKYMAFHHLNFKIKPNLHIGLFESVVYGDSTGGLKLEYLNPIIFYRAIEQQNGSADNALIGMDFKWNIKSRLSIYGQLVIDELIVSEAFSGSGWWGNKQGFQFGAKYLRPFGIDGLMLQGEMNRVRPYVYAHENGFTSYGHYNLPLAHPLGANFTEWLGRAFYQLGRWNFESYILKAKYGNDLGGENFGRDIFKDYTVRRLNANGANIDYGNEHLQGNETDLSLIFFRASYMWKHNLFVDAETTFRSEKDSRGLLDTSATIFGLSIRWNVPVRNYLF